MNAKFISIVMVFLVIGCHRSEIKTVSSCDSFYLSPAEIELLIEKANQGDIESAEKLSNYYLYFEGDTDKAIEYQRIPAEMGDSRGQYNLAFSLISSSNLKEQQEGVYWYKMSAKNGDLYAQESLADLYEDGGVVEQDFCQAKYWYEKAARSGGAFSMVEISKYFEEGICGDRNIIKAYTWLLVAVTQEKQIQPGSLGEKEIRKKIAYFETKLSDSDIKKAKDECDILVKEIEYKKPKDLDL